MSVTEGISTYLAKQDMITWVVQFLEKSQKQHVHQFCVDYSAALLSNMIQTSATLKLLEENLESTEQVIAKTKSC